MIGCKSKSQIEPPILQPENIKIVVNSQKYDSVLYWFIDDYKIDDNGLEFKKERLLNIKKNYSIKQGKIFYGNTLLDRVKVNYTINKDPNKGIIIENGLPSYDYEYNIESVPPYLFDDSGGTLSMNNLLNIFKKGNGDWIEYYLVEYYKDKKYEVDEKAVIKEKGQVKNNFKYGKWTYYNKQGKVDSTKVYKLQDSVDIRFPHCLFNKNEPCY